MWNQGEHRLSNIDLTQFQRDYSWLYFNHVENGYKCKKRELFHVVDAMKMLTDHSKSLLQNHTSSEKLSNNTKTSRYNTH